MRDWNTGFLKNIDNKKELFPLLSKELVKRDLGGRLLLSTMQSVISNKQQDISDLQPCNDTEGDTRILLYIAHTANQGLHIALMRTVDSDVVILAIHWFASLGLSELWVCLSTGKKIRDIPIYSSCPVRTIKMHCSVIVPCSHWLRYSLTHSRMWQKDSLVSLAEHHWTDRHTGGP